jgi:hypothetical protein
MYRLLSLLPLVLLLVGCRSTGKSVNPFLGSTTVPAQPTGAIGPGANNAAPYYPPNVVPGQPSGIPTGSPYSPPITTGQPQWMPQGTGSLDNTPASGQYAATPNVFRASGDVVDLDAQMRTAANSASNYDPQVQAAGASPAASNTNTLSIGNPVSYGNAQESAVRVPTDNSPLVTQRLQLPPIVQFTPVATAPAPQQLQPSYSPPVYNTQAGYTQTLLPAQRNVTPVAALNSNSGQQIVPAAQAAMAYSGTRPIAMTVIQQQIQPQYQQQIQLQPIPQYGPTGVSSSPSGVPTLATGPTLATAQTPAIRTMPAVEFDNLPPVGIVHQ